MRRTAIAVCLAVVLNGNAIAPARASAPVSAQIDAAGGALPFAHAWSAPYRPLQQPVVPTGALPVSNCDDSGSGSLRDAIDNAVSGDTIDLTQLTCSRITLTGGVIGIGIDDLTIVAADTKYTLVIEAAGDQGVLFHAGTGTLTLKNVAIEHGRKYMQNSLARGGCVFSAGNVVVDHGLFLDCQVVSGSSAQLSRGGAIYAASSVTLQDFSAVSQSVAGTAQSYGQGGAVFAGTNAILSQTQIAGNSASGGGGVFAQSNLVVEYSIVTFNDASVRGGGLYADHNVLLANSLLYGNVSRIGGGMYATASTASGLFTIESSTITGNAADCCGGGVAFNSRDAHVYNSTIAGNGVGAAAPAGGGIDLYASTLTLVSSIVASNIDVSGGNHADDIAGDVQNVSIVGGSNLVNASTIALPADTIVAAPQFGGLTSDGATPALSILPASAARDHGANPLNFSSDQRGSGFPRVVGATADIGAFELPDRIFANGFD